MISVFKQKWRIALATVALGSIGLSGTAFAQNTASGVTITNTATVNYSVASISQTPINAVATFVVDAVIDLNVTAVASAVTFTPGQTGVAKAFTVSNTSNATSNFSLGFINLTGSDDFELGNLAVRVDGNGNGTYESASDLATSITGLARNGSIAVFIVGDIPGAAVNTDTGDVQLTANATNPNDSNNPWVSTPGADTAGVDIVVRNLSANATNTFVVASAALSVSKASDVISDPVNLVSANAKAIPGAVVEYTITVSNAVGAQTATLTSISDPVPANTTFTPGQYTGSRDVGVKIGAAAEFFCIAEVGSDTNNDGCSLNGGAVTVGTPAITTIAANTSVVVRFRVTIQ
jgi:uncharacterized repeat protein (TIGR01451 family)